MRRRLLVALTFGVAPVIASWDAVAIPMPPVACDVATLVLTFGPAHTESAVVAVLSPRMPHALIEWPRMASVARAEGFAVVTFRDPRVPIDEWRSAVTSVNAWGEYIDAPPLRMETAERCLLLNHSPAIVVARCGRVHPWPIFGVMPDASWRHVLKSRRTELERLPCP